jgi:multidrug efflux pump subunit AcrB
MPKNQSRTFFQKLSLFFFTRPRKTALLWLVVLVFGAVSYTTLLKREGFPSIETPFALAQGAYLVDDAQKVDSEIAKPLSDFVLKQSGVKAVQTQSLDNFYTAQISYEDNVNAETKSIEIEKAAKNQKLLPEQATLKVEAFKFGFTERGDNLTIAFYSTNPNTSEQQLVGAAGKVAEKIKNQNLSLVQNISIINPYDSATNPATGQLEQTQKSFERFGKRQDDQNKFYNAVVIGVTSTKDADLLELNRQIEEAVGQINDDQEFQGYQAEISGSNAPSINAQISELQRTLLEGLLAVLVVGSIVIAIRASIITVVSMVTVIAIVNGLLYAIGYSLNTITLFALILGLALIVDDTIIMVEALDAQRRKRKDAKKVVEVATRKVSRAMIAATCTAALSFTPLIFVGGILGEFIRAIPVTIISALFTSLLVALIFIPFFARFLLLGKNQLGKQRSSGLSVAVEAKIADFVSRPMMWAKNSKKKLFGVGLTAVFVGLAFVGASGFIFQKVTFNIFPSSKDANQLSTIISFAPGTNIEEAKKISSEVDAIIAEETGSNFAKADYFGQANIQRATIFTDLTDYKDREVRAPQLVSELNDRFDNFSQAEVETTQIDAGPPASPFTVRIDSSEDREAAYKLATDVAQYLETAKPKRPDGSAAQIKSVTPPNLSIYTREDNKAYIEVNAAFEDTDTTTLVTITQQAVEKEFSKERVASYGLSDNALSFDFGQENENQDSFKTLAIAFPLVLLVIYFLLATQFRSLLQPLLIFMAIPFSLFGITLGLYLTDNAFSFFAMLGFFALIGLSIKNTILLTDYANQARATGLGAVDSAREALGERFRPLIATSFTAIVSLIPLAITSPFWEGLAVVLICGLLSSTFLVVTVFPYYYLGSEYLRSKISRKKGLLLIVICIATLTLLVKLYMWLWVLLPVIVLALLAITVLNTVRSRS